jgi:hypothetical protein
MVRKLVKPKRGRPPTGGRDPIVAVRMPDDLQRALDDWRRTQPDLPTKSESIRRIIRQVLKKH